MASYTLFPIKPSEQQLFRMYKQSVAVFWTPEEIDFSKDIADWEKLTAGREAFYQPHSSILRGIRWYRPGESGVEVSTRGRLAGREAVLFLSECDGGYSLGDLLPVD